MNTKEVFRLNDTTGISSFTNPMPSRNISEELENVLLKMVYRISQEKTNVTDNAGNAA